MPNTPTPQQPARPGHAARGPATPSAGTALPPGVAQLTLERFEILKPLGQGGMGRVLLAYDPMLHRSVALKLLDRGPAGVNHADVARFLAEAMLTGRLTHSGIVPVYQVGYTPGAGYWYTMRYVRGRTLEDIIFARRGDDWRVKAEFPLVRLLDVFLRVCEAVAFSHRNGILHRDLKPANIMITDADEVLVMDWGLAKDLHRIDPLDQEAAAGSPPERIAACRTRHEQMKAEFFSHKTPAAAPPQQALPAPHAQVDGLTMPGLVVGTPAYMAPEQMRQRAVLTPASDVYALGGVLYQTLTGTLPIENEMLAALIDRVVNGRIVRISSRPEALHLPKALCDIVDRALSLRPEQRYADAGGLAEELRLYLQGRTAKRPLVRDDYTASRPPETRPGRLGHWTCTSGAPAYTEQGLELTEGSALQSTLRALGDFSCSVAFRPRLAAWTLSVLISGEGEQPSHEVRIGTTDRAFVELFSLRRRVQRRFDLRLQPDQSYTLTVELEEDHLRVSLDDNLLLSYRELFPRTGGVVGLQARAGTLVLQEFQWSSRGAPLQLSYQFLPDNYFRSERYPEARQLYLSLAQSHPDREEGLLALYKAALCSAQLKEIQVAFDTFSRLENTMLDHYCTLGLAHLGVLDGNLDWAWEALKSGYQRHRLPEVRSEMWFALLDVLELYGSRSAATKLTKYLELLDKLDPAPQEMSQTASEYMDLVRTERGPLELRAECTRLLSANAGQLPVVCEALMALWRGGLDDPLVALTLPAADALLAKPDPSLDRTRLLLLRAELSFAQGQYEDARARLEQAVRLTSRSPGDRLWARNWLVLSMYLTGDYRAAFDSARESMKYLDRYSADRAAYLLFMVALVLLATGKPDKAMEALEKARACSGWWGTVAGCVLGQGSTDALRDASYPNVESESLFVAGETYLRLNRNDLARPFLEACRDHPSRRAMTRGLALARLAQLPV
jgi:serine/threonine protein kinase/tetratricopeptide (TPR) repeat protein